MESSQFATCRRLRQVEFRWDQDTSQDNNKTRNKINMEYRTQQKGFMDLIKWLGMAVNQDRRVNKQVGAFLAPGANNICFLNHPFASYVEAC